MFDVRTEQKMCVGNSSVYDAQDLLIWPQMIDICSVYVTSIPY